MCMVSMVLDYGQRTPPEDYTLKNYFALWEMIEAAKKFDEKQGEKDCEDPAKVDFLKQIIDRLERIEKRLDDFDAKAELDRVNRVLGPQAQPQIIPVVVDPMNPFTGMVTGQPYIKIMEVPSNDTPTRSVPEETPDEAWARKSVGYCPKCGSQWVEAPCADPEHRRRRYAS